MQELNRQTRVDTKSSREIFSYHCFLPDVFSISCYLSMCPWYTFRTVPHLRREHVTPRTSYDSSYSPVSHCLSSSLFIFCDTFSFPCFCLRAWRRESVKKGLGVLANTGCTITSIVAMKGFLNVSIYDFDIYWRVWENGCAILTNYLLKT